mmetsp:Transcript_23102/g.87393  ORF Transcript_23102/g.87393 Transcript_23102/m.87393 type:complete len:323 (-) Transcript_23102:1986-2954(-)
MSACSWGGRRWPAGTPPGARPPELPSRPWAWSSRSGRRPLACAAPASPPEPAASPPLSAHASPPACLPNEVRPIAVAPADMESLASAPPSTSSPLPPWCASVAASSVRPAGTSMPPRLCGRCASSGRPRVAPPPSPPLPAAANIPSPSGSGAKPPAANAFAKRAAPPSRLRAALASATSRLALAWRFFRRLSSACRLRASAIGSSARVARFETAIPRPDKSTAGSAGADCSMRARCAETEPAAPRVLARRARSRRRACLARCCWRRRSSPSSGSRPRRRIAASSRRMASAMLSGSAGSRIPPSGQPWPSPSPSSSSSSSSSS